MTQSGHGRAAQLFRKMTLKANGTFNDIRRINVLGDEQEECPWPSKCESFVAAPTAIVGISPANVVLGQVFIRHEPNLSSGGEASHIEVGAFLSRDGQAPEHRELLRLIGTLVERSHSFERGTGARRQEHIVELTDGSKWRIWPGDLATTLGWTPGAEIKALPLQGWSESEGRQSAFV